MTIRNGWHTLVAMQCPPTRPALFFLALGIVSLSCPQLSLAKESAQSQKLIHSAARDLQGMWIGGTLTPIERPADIADKKLFSQAELAEQLRHSTQQFWEAGHRAGDVGRDGDEYLDPNLTILRSGQTSLVVEPADGIVPLRVEAEQRRDFNLSNYDAFESMSQLDRCITREPTALFPSAYNNAYQIVQTPTHLAIVSEMVHDARVIPMDGSPHIDSRIRSWNGDSRAHWEGDSLVIDTTNYNGHGWIGTVGNFGRVRGVPFSEQLHVIERFTRTSPMTLAYEIITDDPAYFNSAWKMAFAFQRDDSYRMLEYACHEGNRAIEAIMRGARAR